MKSAKILYIIGIILIYICLIGAFLLVSPYYRVGNPNLDMGLSMACITLVLGSSFYVFGKNDYNIQSIAFNYQLISYAAIMGGMILAHLLSSVFCTYDWSIWYYIGLLILTIIFLIRLFTVHVGGDKQQITEQKLAELTQAKSETVHSISPNSSQILSAIQNSGLTASEILRTSDAVRETVDMINSISLKAFSRSIELNREVKEWDEMLKKQNVTLVECATNEEKKAILHAIYENAISAYKRIVTQKNNI